MKISKLHIDQFRHLENLDFDFTYQSGDRKGQPLDKICFIGQSATGKTSLLELIKLYISNPIKNDFNFKIDLDLDGKKLIYNEQKKIIEIVSETDNKNFNMNAKLYYFPCDLLSTGSFNKIAQNPTKPDRNNALSYSVNNISVQKKSKFEELKSKSTLEFNHNTSAIVWDYLLDGILEYREKLTQKGSDIVTLDFGKDFEKLIREMEKWKRDNPNPLIQLSEECLNPILKKFNLEVDLADTSSFIPLKPINSDIAIPANALSTGTKQLMLNSLPLYKLDTKNSIVTIDEPERSLFPDIQMELMDYYQNLAPEAQFIVATHSPFIAAAFQPDERFILYFDEKGKVAVRRGSSPIGDDPNDMLYNDFGINYINKYGQQKYQEYLDLKQKIHFENDPKKKEEISEQLEKLGEEYNF
nr:AAA family ATPase [uncultured Flavobacterium sp.]